MQLLELLPLPLGYPREFWWVARGSNPSFRSLRGRRISFDACGPVLSTFFPSLYVNLPFWSGRRVTIPLFNLGKVTCYPHTPTANWSYSRESNPKRLLTKQLGYRFIRVAISGAGDRTRTGVFSLEG